MSRRLLLLLILILTLVGAAVALSPSTTISAQRAAADDGVITATVYAGHHFKTLALRVVWQRSGNGHATALFAGNNTITRVSVITLPPSSPFLEDDVPSDWYDGESPLTYARLLFQSQAQTRAWHVSTSPYVSRAILYLGVESSLWLSHSAVVFTGAQLRFFERQPGVHCSAMTALAATASDSPQHAQHSTLWLNTPTVHRLGVYDGVHGVRIAEWNVTLEWAVEDAQSTVPTAAAAALALDVDNLLMLDDTVLVATGADLNQARLLAPAVDSVAYGILRASAAGVVERVVIGRRLLELRATSWATDADGHVAVRFATAHLSNFVTATGAVVATTSSTDSIPLAVHWVVAICGVFLVWMSAYWTSHLGMALELHYTPPYTTASVGNDDDDDDSNESEGVRVVRGDIICGYVIVALAILVHALLVVYGGHDVLVDNMLEQPLMTFIRIFNIGSLVVGVVFVFLLAVETARSRGAFYGTHNYRVISVQLFAIGLSAVTSRALTAALLLGAGLTEPQYAFAMAAAVGFAYFPAVYSLFILAPTVASGGNLFLPFFKMPRTAWPARMYARVLEAFVLLVQVVNVVMLTVTIPLFLVNPFLEHTNSFYNNNSLLATSLVLMALPFFVAAIAVAMARRRSIKRQVREMTRAMKDK